MEQIEEVTVMAKRILGVVRVSTVVQEIESQKKELQEFIETKGYCPNQIVWIEVKGASARKENDKYLAMIDDIKRTIEAKEVEAVALWHLNRLGRTETSLSKMKEYFEKKKIQVYIKNPSLQLFDIDPKGQKTLNYGCSIAWSLFATMIKFDTIEQFEKTQRGKRYAKEEGKCVSGRARYGYTIDEKKFIHENSEESKIVRLIYDKYINENTTAKQIAQWLNENGYTRQSEQCTEPKLWTEPQVRIILSNTTYIGKGKYRYPAIIDEEQFRKCQEIRKTRNIAFDKAVAQKHYYLCSKLIKCEYCGHTYEVKGKNYQDAGARPYYGRKAQKCTHGMSIPIKYADIAIKRSYVSCYMMYLDNAEKEDKNKLNSEIINLQARIDNVTKEVLKSKGKLKKIADSYVDGSYTKEQYNNKLTKVKTEIGDLNERIEDLQRQIQSNKNKIQMIDDKVDSPEKLADRYDKISIYSKEEIYNKIHDKKNKLINYAYIRKARIDNRIMTVFNVVTNIGTDTYLIDSFNRKEENKLMSVFSLKGKMHVSRYIESEEMWIPDLSAISLKMTVEALEEMRKK